MAELIRQRRVGKPRPTETYRFDRRNHSDLNRDRKTWYGVEGKLRPEPPALVLISSERGETHYVKQGSEVLRRFRERQNSEEHSKEGTLDKEQSN